LPRQLRSFINACNSTGKRISTGKGIELRLHYLISTGKGKPTPENSASVHPTLCSASSSASLTNGRIEDLRSLCTPTLAPSTQPRGWKPHSQHPSRSHQRLPSNRSIRPAPLCFHLLRTPVPAEQLR